MLSLIFSMILGAQAYQYLICLDRDLRWESNNVTMRASNVSFADPNWMNSLSTAIGRWNQSPSNFSYSLVTDTNGVKRGNGQNEVWFSSDPGALQGAPAIAYYWYECVDYWIFGKTVKLTETDVIFDVNEAYTPFMSNKSALWEYGGGSRPFQTTALHELGHGLGLQHTNYTYNIMGQDWTHIHVNGATARSYIGEDAARGAAHLYGNKTLRDLSVSQWKYSGASGEYSSHTRTVMRNASGGVLPTSVVNGEVRYHVNPGQTVRVEFTFENNGSSTENISTGYYLSTNDLITTVDTKIAEIGMTLSPDSVFTFTQSVTIPASTPHGVNRWLGAIVDNKNVVSELIESNNATYIPVWIL